MTNEDIERWLTSTGWTPMVGASRPGIWIRKGCCYGLAQAVRLQSNLDHRRRSLVLHCLYLTVIAILLILGLAFW